MNRQTIKIIIFWIISLGFLTYSLIFCWAPAAVELRSQLITGEIPIALQSIVFGFSPMICIFLSIIFMDPLKIISSKLKDPKTPTAVFVGLIIVIAFLSMPLFLDLGFLMDELMGPGNAAGGSVAKGLAQLRQTLGEYAMVKFLFLMWVVGIPMGLGYGLKSRPKNDSDSDTRR